MCDTINKELFLDDVEQLVQLLLLQVTFQMIV